MGKRTMLEVEANDMSPFEAQALLKEVRERTKILDIDVLEVKLSLGLRIEALPDRNIEALETWLREQGKICIGGLDLKVRKTEEDLSARGAQ